MNSLCLRKDPGVAQSRTSSLVVCWVVTYGADGDGGDELSANSRVETVP